MISAAEFGVNPICCFSANVGPTKNQEMAGIHRITTKSWSGLERSMMSHLPNLSSIYVGLSANAEELLDKSEARKWQEFSRACPKVNQASGVQYNEFTYQIGAQSDQRFIYICSKCTETSSVINGQMDNGIPMSPSNSVGWGKIIELQCPVLACIYVSIGKWELFFTWIYVILGHYKFTHRPLVDIAVIFY